MTEGLFVLFLNQNITHLKRRSLLVERCVFKLFDGQQTADRRILLFFFLTKNRFSSVKVLIRPENREIILVENHSVNRK
jgi:hypothetical protein